jgi:hypothetical protein
VLGDCSCRKAPRFDPPSRGILDYEQHYRVLDFGFSLLTNITHRRFVLIALPVLIHSVLHGVSPTSTVRESHIRSPPSSVSPRYKGITVFRFNERPATLNSQSRTSRPIQPQQQDYTPYQVTTANTTQRSPYFQRFRTNGSPTVNHMDYLRSFQNGWEDSSNP